MLQHYCMGFVMFIVLLVPTVNHKYPDSKVHGANMGPTWVLSAPDGPYVGPMDLAIWVLCSPIVTLYQIYFLTRIFYRGVSGFATRFPCSDWWPGLTHWGWVTHIYVGNVTIIGSDNGLTPNRHQAIIWTNAGILVIDLLGTNFSAILI